ncbi:hypothetical protein PF008_g2112 [Phytophthora fragariae]|nr:hypothetical protein PF008_g2112 [Phytophthora fragariae]
MLWEWLVMPQGLNNAPDVVREYEDELANDSDSEREPSTQACGEVRRDD